MAETPNKKSWIIRLILPEQNRKGIYCFYSLLAAVLLTAFGRMQGEQAAYVIIGLASIFVGGNAYEHFSKKGATPTKPEEKPE